MNRAVTTAAVVALVVVAVPAAAAPAPPPSTATVMVKDSLFVAPSVTLQLDGTGRATVTWQWETTSMRPHSVRDDAKKYDSHPACSGSGAGVAQCGLTGVTSFTQTFTKAGTYRYHCAVHGGPKSGMAGTIVVKAAPRAKR